MDLYNEVLKKISAVFLFCTGMISLAATPIYAVRRRRPSISSISCIIDGVQMHFQFDDKGHIIDRTVYNAQRTRTNQANEQHIQTEIQEVDNTSHTENDGKKLVIHMINYHPLVNASNAEKSVSHDFNYDEEFERFMYSLGIQGLYGIAPERKETSFRLPGILEEIPFPNV